MALPIYEPDDMQKALREVAEILGHVPSIKEYEFVRGRELAEWLNDPNNMRAFAAGKAIFWMPSVMTIRARYKNWSNAIAHIKGEFPNSYKKQDVSFLRQLITKMGRSVTEKEYEEFRRTEVPQAPHSASLLKNFKNWTGVLEAAGTIPSHYRYWKNEELIGMVVTLGKELGRMPSVSEYDRAAKGRGWPVSRQFYRRFDKWSKVRIMVEPIIAAHVAKRGYKPDEETCRTVLRQRETKTGPNLRPLKVLAEDLGRAPTIHQYTIAREGNRWPSAELLKKRFDGSWRNVLLAAGISEDAIEKLPEAG